MVKSEERNLKSEFDNCQSTLHHLPSTFYPADYAFYPAPCAFHLLLLSFYLLIHFYFEPFPFDAKPVKRPHGIILRCSDDPHGNIAGLVLHQYIVLRVGNLPGTVVVEFRPVVIRTGLQYRTFRTDVAANAPGRNT